MGVTSSNFTGTSAFVPTRNNPACVAAVRSLGRRGINTIVGSYDENDPAFVSKYCTESVVMPDPTEGLQTYKNALLSVAARPDVRTILPLREEEIYTLVKYRSEFEDHVELPLPSLEKLGVAQDRLQLIPAAEEAGVTAPETWRFDEIESWDRNLFIKSRFAILANEYLPEQFTEDEMSSSTAVRYVPPGTEPAQEDIQTEMEHVPVVQEFVQGDGIEYSVRALCNQGDTLAMSVRRQHRGSTYAGGTSAYRVSARIPRLEETTRTLLEHIDWHGPCSVQYIKDVETDEFVLLEINPRFWASLALDVRAGVDFPYYYWLLANGRESQIDPDLREDIGVHRLTCELRYLKSLFTDDYPLVERPPLTEALKEFSLSFYEQPHFDFFQRDDPKPFVRNVRNVLGSYKP